jgi:membrane-bound lytic murein transglycosylase D
VSSVPPDASNAAYAQSTAQVAVGAQGSSQSSAEPAEQPTRVAGLVPAQYADLFDRMRSGFRLKDDPERRTTEQELNWYVNNPDYVERAFGRSDLYMYHIVTELEARGMPLEIALLPVVESAFEPYAYSHARASGLWQFIPDTGSRFGLKQDWWYDGRRDIVESTRAALDYLDSLHDEFYGDWLLAIAAYNCGELAVEHAIDVNRSLGLPITFWDLKLPKETRAYVPKLLAMKRLVANPESYGLSISPIPNQPYFAQVETKGQISLKLAAEIAGISPEDVYELNPAFHRWATDPMGPYRLLLPVDAVDAFNRSIGELTDEERLGALHYRVKKGDSVASIAKQFHTTVNVVRELNDMPDGRPGVGQDLLLPSKVSLPSKVLLAASRIDRPAPMQRRRWHVQVVRAGETLTSIARRHGMNVHTLATLNGLSPNEELRAGQKLRLSGISESRPTRGSVRRVVYTVRTGDTLDQIARIYQVSVAQLLSWNRVHSHGGLHTGQKLTIRVATRRG